VFVDVLSAMGGAADILLQPKILFYIFLGTFIGTFLAAIPGVGGLLGLALLLPFTFSMSAHEAVAFLLGALAVLSTADTIPAVLFGVPGTPTSMATVLDGYPMAQRGEAGRALGAAFTSSILGGVIGVLPLVIVIPIIMPILLGATSPELLGVCVLGLAMVAALSGSSMYKGLAAASIGILLAMIGQDSFHGIGDGKSYSRRAFAFRRRAGHKYPRVARSRQPGTA
jgi:TctA family transporter